MEISDNRVVPYKGSMAELAQVIHDQILVRLSVKDLIRYKSVCKSWLSLISSTSFIKAHLNHSYNNIEIGRRRILMSTFGYVSKFCNYVVEDRFFYEYNYCRLIGSSNGLVCICTFRSDYFVVNPLTREVKKLQNPEVCSDKLFCWGFGHDSSTDDYKIILGFRKDNNLACFQVLTLKSNFWEVIREVTYWPRIVNTPGVLCNEALHWFMYDQNGTNIIVSFDLSKEEFKEIPQPDDARYKYSTVSKLGIIKECLCIFLNIETPSEKWVMKNYNVKQSWELDDSEITYDVAHLKHLMDYNRITTSFFCDDIQSSRAGDYIGAPIYVPSLVSPNVDERPKKGSKAYKWNSQLCPLLSASLVIILMTSHFDISVKQGRSVEFQSLMPLK